MTVTLQAEPLNQLLQDIGFDAAAYVARHGDLVDAGFTPEDGLRHFLVCGVGEHRIIPVALPLWQVIRQVRTSPVGADAQAAVILGATRHAVSQPRTVVDRALALLDTRGEHRCVVVVGDSHTELFQKGDMAKGIVVAPIPCIAGSARGLGAPSSRSGYGERVKAALLRAAPLCQSAEAADSQRVLFMFGQVDLEFVFDFNRIKAGERVFHPLRVLAFLRETADRYFAYLDDACAPLPAAAVAVSSILPPALSDATVRAGYVFNPRVTAADAEMDEERLRAGLRALEMPDHKTRTLVAAVFNEHLRARAERRGFLFVDAFRRFLGEDGVVDPLFVGEAAGTDHHLALSQPPAQGVARDLLQQLFAG